MLYGLAPPLVELMQLLPLVGCNIHNYYEHYYQYD